MILFIDNYDSFVYNLVQYVSRHRQDYLVLRNDDPAYFDLDFSTIDRVILSPGPCGPQEAGHSNDAIERFAHRIPILGICLGLQCIAHVFGLAVRRGREAVHGKASRIVRDESRIFENVPFTFEAARYHSLVVEGDFPASLRPIAWLRDGTVMGLEHRSLPLFGLQFHPESILTPCGRTIVQNFLEVDVQSFPLLGSKDVLALPSSRGTVER